MIGLSLTRRPGRSARTAVYASPDTCFTANQPAACSLHRKATGEIQKFEGIPSTPDRGGALRQGPADDQSNQRSASHPASAQARRPSR